MALTLSDSSLFWLATDAAAALLAESVPARWSHLPSPPPELLSNGTTFGGLATAAAAESELAFSFAATYSAV